jgi:hypothetical protein
MISFFKVLWYVDDYFFKFPIIEYFISRVMDSTRIYLLMILASVKVVIVLILLQQLKHQQQHKQLPMNVILKIIHFAIGN